MTYDEAIQFWFGRINFEVRSAAPTDLKLERMRALLRSLGNPHERLRIIHVAGTKGKGSTCAMIASVLTAAGYRTGLFTSPHLVHVEERIRIDGAPIERAELCARMEQVEPAVLEAETGPWPRPTFFEISTAIGFLHFLLRRVDFAVVEVGLGGRFDSTNVCKPIVAAITSIGMDHMGQLGGTLEEIAFQKAGIIKPRVPTICGVTHPGARAVIDRVAEEVGSPLVQVERDFRYSVRSASYEPETGVLEPTRTTVVADRVLRDVPLGLLGDHQAANAATAVAVLDQLRHEGITIPDPAILQGLRDAKWPARIELISTRPTVILDSAHNVPAAEALVDTLRKSIPTRGRRSVVFAVSSDKQYAEILRILGEVFDHFHLTKYSDNPRGVAAEKMQAILKEVAPDRSSEINATPREAWHAARSRATPDDLVCVTGSVFLAGELRDFVRG